MKKIPNYKPNQIVFLGLASIIVLGLILQFETINSNYFIIFRKMEETGIVCFFDPYPWRWMVQQLGFLGLMLSSSILYKRDWKLFEYKLDNLILSGPILIFVLDEVIINTF